MTTSKHPPFSADGHATLIGSIPVRDHQEALNLIFAHTPAIPLWPQLPGNPKEGMLNQFVEDFPGLVEENGRTFFDSGRESFAAEQLAFFEQYLAVSEDPALLADSIFKSSEERAPGLYRFRERLQAGPTGNRQAAKGQITGPFTLLTGLKDAQQQDAWYDPALREIVVKGLAMRAAWQAGFLRQCSGNQAIVFLDEPALAGLGSSAYISVSLAEIGADLNEVLGAVRGAGALNGIHVCANTDWDFILGLDLDILSFDAYSYFDRLAGSRAALYAFLDRGGILAWGLVPTSEAAWIEQENAASLARRWNEQAQTLVNDQWDLPRLLSRTLITPSCGTGSLPLPLARRVLELTSDLSAALRTKHLTD